MSNIFDTSFYTPIRFAIGTTVAPDGYTIMQNQTPIIERAFQLARSGEYQNWVEVSTRLRAEGYQNVEGHFGGMMLKKQIGTACKDAAKSMIAA